MEIRGSCCEHFITGEARVTFMSYNCPPSGVIALFESMSGQGEPLNNVCMRQAHMVSKITRCHALLLDGSPATAMVSSEYDLIALFSKLLHLYEIPNLSISYFET